ncbi:retrotransposon-derived protein PEG10, partial [Clarias magur]
MQLGAAEISGAPQIRPGCFRCGRSGHHQGRCPLNKQKGRGSLSGGRPIVTQRSDPQRSGHFLPIDITWEEAATTHLKAFVDSGAAGNLIDVELVRRLAVPFHPLSSPIPVAALD